MEAADEDDDNEDDNFGDFNDLGMHRDLDDSDSDGANNDPEETLEALRQCTGIRDVMFILSC